MRLLQPVEFFVRSIPLRLMLAALGGRRDEPLPDWRQGTWQILVIRDDGIGDLLLTVETVRAIAEAGPGVQVDLLASPQNAAFARRLPFVRDVLVHERSARGLARTARTLRSRRYDAVVDTRATIRTVKTHTGALMTATGARWRVGVGGGRVNDWFYTVRTDPSTATHIQEIVASLAQPFGVSIRDRDWRARVTVSDDERAGAERAWERAGTGRPRVLVNISVGNDERLWRHDRYAPVLARLRERLPRAAVIVSAMPADLPTGERLAAAIGAAAIPLSFGDLMAVVASADFVVTPDTAVAHLTSAFQTPVLALMRNGTQAWAPYRTPGRVAWSDTGRRLEPGLPPERVIRELDALIDDLGPTRGWL